jgi:predicted small lipoprotein YifL
MKTIYKIFAILCALIALASCGIFKTPEQTTVSSTTTGPSSTKPLPTYTPGSVKLRDPEWFRNEYEIDYEMRYRKCYYSIPGTLEVLIVEWGIATSHEVTEYVNKMFVGNPNAGTDNVMALKLVVQKFNIPREKFDEFTIYMINAYKDLGFDASAEEYELPNADIIYTFDNDIINEYYRRE